MERTRSVFERDNFMGKKVVSHAYSHVCDDLILVSILIHVLLFYNHFCYHNTIMLSPKIIENFLKIFEFVLM